MSLYKQRDSKNWWISIYLPYSCKRIRFSSGTPVWTKAEAIEAAFVMASKRVTPAQHLHALIDSILGVEENPKLTLSDAFARYYLSLKQRGRLTCEERMRSVELVFGKFVHFIEGLRQKPCAVQDITRQDAMLFLDSLFRKGLKTKTISNYIEDISAVWNVLTMEMPELTNPWRALSPKVTDSTPGKAFSHEEEKAVITAADEIGEGWGLMCRISRYTGLRFSDVLRLRKSNIDRVNQCLRVTPSKTQAHGVHVILPLPDELYTMLPTCDPLFKTPKTPFRKVLEKAGLADKGFTFHSWRHTFRTRLSESGVSDDIAKRLGGWTNDRMARHYDHAERIDELRAAIQSTVPIDAS